VLLPELNLIDLMCEGQLNPRLRFLSRIGRPFCMMGRSGRKISAKLYIHEISQSGQHYLRAMIIPQGAWSQA
jgi:hypothetical protein